MEPSAKGTVTPLASLFSEEDAKKAASYVEEKIGEKLVEMNRLQQFVEENTNLINLLMKLPDLLHHNVMESRLIHTNEFLIGNFTYYGGDVMGVDDHEKVAKFCTDFKVEGISLTKTDMKFDMICPDKSVPNAFRRILIAESFRRWLLKKCS